MGIIDVGKSSQIGGTKRRSTGEEILVSPPVNHLFYFHLDLRFLFTVSINRFESETFPKTPPCILMDLIADS